MKTVDAGPPLANRSHRNKPPREATRAQMRKAAALVADGKKYFEAEDSLGLKRGFISRCRQNCRAIWEEELARASAGQSQAALEARRETAPFDAIRERIRHVLRIVATGRTITDAAATLGIDREILYDNHRQYPKFWNAEEAAARAEFRALGLQAESSGPRAETLEGIRKATALRAAGLDGPEIAERLGVKLCTLEHWRGYYADAWKQELARAMEATLIVVRRQAGTDAVTADPEAFITRALACERWAKHNGRELFPPREGLTLFTFYESHYRPTRLEDASKETLRAFRNVLNVWRVLTGDPPLKEITHSTLTHFRDCLTKRRGQKRGTKLSSQSIRRYFTCIECLLNKAGPAGYRNRDAANLIANPPWIKKPKPEAKPVRVVTSEEMNAVYRTAATMNRPRLPGFEPAAWWRALLVVARNTGLRRRTIFQMRIDQVDWDKGKLDLPPELLKAGRAFTLHLTTTALEHLRGIRGVRELVFPWPHSETCFYKTFHRLQTAAGIPRKEHFGLHDIRKTLGTVLWEDSPAAAQYALGHSSPEVTRRHYVQGFGIVARALDRMAQPEAFTAGLSASSRGISPARPDRAPVPNVSLEEAQALLDRGRQMQEEAARLIESLRRAPAELLPATW